MATFNRRLLDAIPAGATLADLEFVFAASDPLHPSRVDDGAPARPLVDLLVAGGLVERDPWGLPYYRRTPKGERLHDRRMRAALAARAA